MSALQHFSRSSWWAVLAVSFSVSGCFYGYETDTSVTPLTHIDYPPNPSVAIYYRPPAKDERCIPLALLDIAGSPSETTGEVLVKLEDEAKLVGADAIFSVSSGVTQRTVVTNFDDSRVPYVSHVVTGLAARCDLRTTTSLPPPTGAYGVMFGQPQAAVAAWCAARGATWSSNLSSCVAAPTSGEADLDFRFCDGKLCSIDAQLFLDRAEPVLGHWPSVVGRTAMDLAGRYGLPSAEEVNVPDACQGSRLLRCVSRSRANYTYQWAWHTGESVWLVLTANSGRPEMRVVFTTRVPANG